MICPNCNSQTSTFSGRNSKSVKKCTGCNSPLSRKSSNLCEKCYTAKRRKEAKKLCACGAAIGLKSVRCRKCRKTAVLAQ
jgi:hypothetical protein